MNGNLQRDGEREGGMERIELKAKGMKRESDILRFQLLPSINNGSCVVCENIQEKILLFDRPRTQNLRN